MVGGDILMQNHMQLLDFSRSLLERKV